MSSSGLPLVALGVGNVLLGDDAVGVRVIEGLRDVTDRDPGALPPGTRLVDGGTLGLDLLGTLRDAGGAVLVDAVRLGDPPGTVSVLQGDALADAGRPGPDGSRSAVGELVAFGRLLGWLPEPVVMVGVEVADVEAGARLSPAVAGALGAAMDAVRAELHRMDGDLATGRTGGGATARMAGATA